METKESEVMEIEDSYISTYLNRFDILILIALKRAGLHYGSRKKIISHYKKINNNKKLENDIQTFMFKESKFNSSIDINNDFHRLQKLPFQQGMNNLVPIFRKYGLQKFERVYQNYLTKLQNDNDNIIINFTDSTLGIMSLFINENIDYTKNIGSFFSIANFRRENNKIICNVSRKGDIITNIDINDADKVIKSAILTFNEMTLDKFKFIFDNELSLFNFDVVFAPVALQATEIAIKIELKDDIVITDEILEKLQVSILYHQIPHSQRENLLFYKYYLELVDDYNHNFYHNRGGIVGVIF